MKALVSILIPAYNSTGPCRVRLVIRTVKEQIQAVVLPLPRPTEKRLRLRRSSASFRDCSNHFVSAAQSRKAAESSA